MKTALVLALSCLAINAEVLKLDTLKTAKGKSYEGVTVTEKRPDGISIRHAGGTARIPQEDLPADVKRKLGGFDDAAAEEAREADAAKLRAAERAMDEAEAAKDEDSEDAPETDESGEVDGDEMPEEEAVPKEANKDGKPIAKVEPKNRDKLFVKPIRYGGTFRLQITAKAGAKPLRIATHHQSFEVAPWQQVTRLIPASPGYRVTAFEEDVIVDVESSSQKTGLGSDTKLR